MPTTEASSRGPMMIANSESPEPRSARRPLIHADRESVQPTPFTPTDAEARPSAPVTVTPVSGWKRPVYLLLATLFFGFGTAGILLPGLPATPFLLLTSFFLVRSWPRLNERLTRSWLFGPLLNDWQQHKGVRYHVKVKAVSFVLLTVGLTLALADYRLELKLLTGVLAATGIGVICRLPTARPPAATRSI